MSIVAQVERYDQSPDYGSTIAVQPVGEIPESLDETVARINAMVASTNRSETTYLGLTMNSNSYAFSVVENLGLGRPAPIVDGAYGWQDQCCGVGQ